MAGEEEKPIPRRYWYEFMDRFTRRDELLVEILKELRSLLKEGIKVTVPTEVVIEEITVPVELEFVDRLARRLQQMPNRLDKVEIDTSKTTMRSLRGLGKLKGDILLGFHIESVGGGFTYKIRRGDWASGEKTAVVDDKWDIEFDDLEVSGSGETGTAVLWAFWREVT